MISLLAGLFSVVLSAQSPLQTLSLEMKDSAALIEYSYEMTVSGIKTTGEGEVCVQDSMYRMTGSGLQIVCDGKTVWVSDEAGKEVMIESLQEGNSNYQNNPSLLFFDIESVFNVEGTRKEGAVTTYVLSPKEDFGIVGGTVSVNTSSARPVFESGSFTLSDGSSVVIKIKSMTFIAKKPLTYFYLDISGLDQSWLITDLR